MKQKIIDMLKDSKEVELICVDREGFLSHDRYFTYTNSILLYFNKIVVDHVDGIHIHIVDPLKQNDFVLTVDELKYFKIKEPEYTFNDLIDVAVQAVKDGIIVIKHFDDICLSAISVEDGFASFEEWRGRSDNEDITRAIKYIESLYTETFVIESEEDLCRFSARVDSIVLANGVDIIDEVYFHQGVPYFSTLYAVKVQYSVLKGATVTQKRTHTKSSTTSTEPVQLDLFD